MPERYIPRLFSERTRATTMAEPTVQLPNAVQEKRSDLPDGMEYIPDRILVMDVTPELAARWLERNIHNRPIKSTNLEKIVRDLREGRWQFTAEPIKFSKSGALLDGQHRLWAVVRTGVPATMLIVPGLDETSQDVMDTGVARGAADILALKGEQHTATLAAACRIAIQMERGALAQKMPVTNAQIYAWLAEHPQMRDAVHKESTMRRTLLSRRVVAYALWRLRQVDQDSADEFFTSLSEHRTNGGDDPRSALLSRLTSAKHSGMKLSQATQMSLIFRTWNFWRQGRPVGRITVQYSGNSVDIPQPR